MTLVKKARGEKISVVVAGSLQALQGNQVNKSSSIAALSIDTGGNLFTQAISLLL